MSSVLIWICWTPPNKIPGYATVKDQRKEEGSATNRHCRHSALLATSPFMRVIAVMTLKHFWKGKWLPISVWQSTDRCGRRAKGISYSVRQKHSKRLKETAIIQHAFSTQTCLTDRNQGKTGFRAWNIMGALTRHVSWLVNKLLRMNTFVISVNCLPKRAKLTALNIILRMSVYIE